MSIGRKIINLIQVSRIINEKIESKKIQETPKQIRYKLYRWMSEKLDRPLTEVEKGTIHSRIKEIIASSDRYRQKELTRLSQSNKSLKLEIKKLNSELFDRKN